jgi:hypothetical protein
LAGEDLRASCSVGGVILPFSGQLQVLKHSALAVTIAQADCETVKGGLRLEDLGLAGDKLSGKSEINNITRHASAC